MRIVSILLLIFVVNKFARKAFSEASEGIVVKVKIINNIRYADDTTSEDLQNFII